MRYAWLQRRRLHGYDRKGSGKTSLLSIQRGSVSKHEKSTKSVMPNRREGCPQFNIINRERRLKLVTATMRDFSAVGLT